MVRAAPAVAAAAAIILSSPFVQQGFSAISAMFPSIGLAATGLPIAVAVIVAAAAIRDRRLLRFSALALSVAIAAGYVLVNSLIVTETFHFVEYGMLACLVYAALIPADDASILLLPVVLGMATGIVDEWFQWFVPIRVGEMRDIGLDGVASVCGVLFAVSVRPPPRLRLTLGHRSAARVGIWTAVAVALFGVFIVTVHVGYEVRDPEIGMFVSRYTDGQLADLAQDRATRWRSRPPVAVRRLWREDQYLSEGLWHVQRRNQAWEQGDVANAWRENLILEKFFSPVLDTPTYSNASAQRWSADLRADAASRPGVDRRPLARGDYRYPLYVF